ncbi:hypothetical protein QE152_g33068 [Popillia japonica]|uniref:Uncharacterized protein n=1 Tax=Popillia japonica TaxID=7064 RepID=A0AAW1IYI1_POPJA
MNELQKSTIRDEEKRKEGGETSRGDMTPQNTIDVEMTNPFEKRDFIQRTPPRERASLITSLEDLKNMRKDPFHPRKIHYQSKRKRIENCPENQRLTSQGVPATDLQSILRGICGQIEALENMVSDTYKPKKELVEIASQLALEREKLISQEIQAQIKLTTQKPENYEEEQLEREKLISQEIQAQIKLTTQKPENYEEEQEANEPICEECKKAKIQHLRRKRLIGDGTWNMNRYAKNVKKPKSST